MYWPYRISALILIHLLSWIFRMFNWKLFKWRNTAFHSNGNCCNRLLHCAMSIWCLPVGKIRFSARVPRTSYRTYYILFISLESEQCIFHFKLADSRFLSRAIVLSDGRICVGGGFGYCTIFQPQQEAGRYINEYTARLFPHTRALALAPFFTLHLNSPSMEYN